ncbi:MAG: HEPN domain-containing protein [Candidatus Freyarchaeota archaeon]|nr:HEPN domain-containing protein [Candidatus Freyarchaeota archaeon]
MKDIDISELVKKANESLEAAKLLLRGGYPDFSASRSYYSMFYAAQAILLTRNLAFSKHSTVISAFGKEFIKNGLLPPTLHLQECLASLYKRLSSC